MTSKRACVPKADWPITWDFVRRLLAVAVQARANEQRAWQPWAHLAGKLITKARSLDQDEPRAIDWDLPVIAMDSSLIDLSLPLCPWANYTGNKAVLKLHAGLDLQGPCPLSST